MNANENNITVSLRLESNYKINNEPSNVHINLDTYPIGNGLKSLKITCNEKEFVFLKEDVFKFLEYLKNGC